MPQPNKKRGRRGGETKRSRDDDDEVSLKSGDGSKRRKAEGSKSNDGVLHIAEDHGAYQHGAAVEPSFFGVLDEEEQEYFRRADDMLEANAFGDADERGLFLSNVYREAEGKELKIAQSQSCSRLMERLIQLSTPDQLKSLFQKFSGNFIHLVTHRFASHCCEALLLRAAPNVTEELSLPQSKDLPSTNPDDVFVPMEILFLHTLAELEGHVGFLLTDRHASHVLRVLLLVLSGEPLDSASAQHLLQSKRKETNVVQGHRLPKSLATTRRVPGSFSAALEKLIADSVAGLDTHQLRALATHHNGNPTLQLLLKLELSHYGKQRAKDERSIIRTILPDDPITADSDSAKFINGIVYDPVGSHLVEQIIEHAPAKVFKALYSEFFKQRLVTHARNDIAGYVVCRILERLGHDDLLEAHENIVPHISDLLRRNRTVVVRTLIERCTVRDIDTQAIAVQVDATWHGPYGFEIKTLLKVDRPEAEVRVAENCMQTVASESIPTRDTASVKAHFNILAQAMLLVPGSLSALVLDSLVRLDRESLISMAQDNIVSRTLQAALTCRNSSMITTRKLIQHFYGHMGELALGTAASHVVDCMWEGTHGLAFIRERIAEELAENEASMRESTCGRAVWKNWKMDLYKRRRGDWIQQSKMKASNDGFQSFSELDQAKDDGSKKTPLELARERHVKKSARQKTASAKSGSKSQSSARGGSGRSAGKDAHVVSSTAAA